ncbi:MAG: hypothetical protein JEZ07_00555 [Phycisphaerae bacterium]|nr:hypothetical protein [Phycisphaerae bacterium]
MSLQGSAWHGYLTKNNEETAVIPFYPYLSTITLGEPTSESVISGKRYNDPVRGYSTTYAITLTDGMMGGVRNEW